MKVLEKPEKKLVESNELVKKDFNVDRDNIPFHEQRKIFNGLMKKDFLNFRIQKKKLILII